MVQWHQRRMVGATEQFKGSHQEREGCVREPLKDAAWIRIQQALCGSGGSGRGRQAALTKNENRSLHNISSYQCVLRGPPCLVLACVPVLTCYVSFPLADMAQYGKHAYWDERYTKWVQTKCRCIGLACSALIILLMLGSVCIVGCPLSYLPLGRRRFV